MAKKIIKILGALVLLVLIAAVALPYLFKDQIIEKVKTEANNNLNAKVDFGSFSLSLLTSFPDFSFTIEDVKVEGVEEFEGITLADIGRFEVTIDVMSVIGGDQIKIKSFGLDDPKLHAKVLKDGKANWDIAKSDDQEEEITEEPAAEEETAFNVALKRYYIKNAHIIYDDATDGTYAELYNLTHEGNGDFTQDIFTLFTTTRIDAITAVSGGVKYLNKAEIDIKFDIDMDMPNSKYTFTENEFQINGLFLGFDGWVAMPGEDIDMDIKYYTQKTDFKSLLSMVPAVYARDFESVQTDGELVLDGFAKGTLTENSLPAFALNLLVENARFQYPELPNSAENIQIAVNIANPGGSEDQTVIDISNFHVELGENPLDVKMLVKTPVSDPYIKGTIKSQLNMGTLKDVIPMEEGESYSGSLTADINLDGNLSSIENERYEDFKAEGTMIILDMDYRSPDLPYLVALKKMYLNFSPRFVELSAFESNIGKSDISANGKVENFLAYYFKDEPLKGRFSMSSKLMDLDELMAEEEAAATEESSSGEGEEEPLEVFEVPGNINFVMTASMDQMLYDGMEMSNVTGGITIRDSKVLLDQLSMNTLGGNLAMNGSYGTENPKAPEVKFGLDIRNFDVQQTFKTFNTVQTMAPVAENCFGSFSCNTTYNSTLDEKMDPVMNSLNGEGRLTTHNVTVENSELLTKVGSAIKMDKFKSIALNNVDISFKFSEGKITVEPFDFKMGDINAKMGGSNSFEQDIDYLMNLEIPSDMLGGEASKAVAGLMGEASKALGTDVSMGDKINMDVLIGGTMSNPTIKPKFKGSSGEGGPVENLKEKAKEELEKKKEEVKEKVEEKVEEVKEDAKAKAREEAAKIMKDAEKQAAKIRSESKSAAEKVRKEGYDAAKAVEDKAKNPLQKVAAKKTADKMRKETDEKADRMIKEGNDKADAVMNEAKKNADKLN